jgi:hypothetical protein
MRFALPALGAMLTIVMAVFAFTPLAWMLQGRPDESYPEIVFGLIGLPLALIVLAAGAWAIRTRGANTRLALRAVAGLAVAGCVGLLAAALLPERFLSGGVAAFLLNTACLAAPVLVAALAVLAVQAALRRRNRAARP